MPKRNRPSDSYEPPTIQNLLQCIAFHDDERDKADIHRDSALAALRPLADKHGMRLDAVRSALRLRKLQPAEVAAYLADFNLVVAALGLDAQEELFPRGAVSVTVQSVN
jgi:hypothetical protein